MYRTLKKEADGYRGTCPTCGATATADGSLKVVATCPHLVRVWRVAADRRVRVEFRRETDASAGATV